MANDISCIADKSGNNEILVLKSHFVNFSFTTDFYIVSNAIDSTLSWLCVESESRNGSQYWKLALWMLTPYFCQIF